MICAAPFHGCTLVPPLLQEENAPLSVPFGLCNKSLTAQHNARHLVGAQQHTDNDVDK